MVDVFTRSVPVYAPVNAYVHGCVAVSGAVHVFAHPSIYAPEQKIEIENRTHPQNRNSKFKFKIKSLASKIKFRFLKFQNYFSKTY